jgi:hypothetical protein
MSVLDDLGTALAALIIVGSVPRSGHAPGGSAKSRAILTEDRADACLEVPFLILERLPIS